MPSKSACFISICSMAVACSKNEASETGAPAAQAETPAAANPAVESSSLLSEGDQAPEVEAKAHTGKLVRLSQFRGKPVVVYFYPKDDSPGCTMEAQEIRDLWQDLLRTDAVVLGVSTDDNASHQAFAEKYELPFLLLPDTEQRIARAFGVPVNNGRAKRATFVIDRQGKVRKVFGGVSPKGHGMEILNAVKALSS
jgi:peroxiredoxin Q/BCP